ncbi:hypothetical protein BLNAU_3629 [Blattamonas nauphoetae]|uniref:Myb-like domain-containing protein n=1 Tax=Blattamonas nauphoetae TaxID=2049346 RepID=A0ABQ9YCP2_9EUKA|nr:hypothetical protein BLNAU_3629 [Blattamonas nauphoetae]
MQPSHPLPHVPPQGQSTTLSQRSPESSPLSSRPQRTPPSFPINSLSPSDFTDEQLMGTPESRYSEVPYWYQMTAVIDEPIIQTISLHLFDTFITCLGEAARAPDINLLTKIENFFRYIVQHTRIEIGETIHAIILIDKVLLSEHASDRSPDINIVSVANVGTLLLCGVALAFKMDRDVPYKNGFWSKVFRIPVPVMNQSEIVCLSRLKYQVFVPAEDFGEYQAMIMGGSSDLHLASHSKPENESCFIGTITSSRTIVSPREQDTPSKQQNHAHPTLDSAADAHRPIALKPNSKSGRSINSHQANHLFELSQKDKEKQRVTRSVPRHQSQGQKRTPWTQQEDDQLLRGLKKHGKAWIDIINDREFIWHRTNVQLKDRFRILSKDIRWRELLDK